MPIARLRRSIFRVGSLCKFTQREVVCVIIDRTNWRKSKETRVVSPLHSSHSIFFFAAPCTVRLEQSLPGWRPPKGKRDRDTPSACSSSWEGEMETLRPPARLLDVPLGGVASFSRPPYHPSSRLFPSFFHEEEERIRSIGKIFC